MTCSTLTSSKLLSAILATEIAMFYYAFGSWKAAHPGKGQFTGYRESGVLPVLSGILLILAIETFWMHQYLMKLSSLFAWIILCLSIYSGIQLVAHLKALRSRTHSFQDKGLKLRYGLFAEVYIGFEQIQEVVFTAEKPQDKAVGKLALLADMEPHNILLRLTEPVCLERPYGLRSKASTICFQCDDPARFIDLLEKKM